MSWWNLFGLRCKSSNESHDNTHTDTDMADFLVVGLGNIGAEYEGTRHNIGFMVADALAEETGASFSSGRYGQMAKFRVKNARINLLKPSTFMNLSGVAVRYWMNTLKLPIGNLLIIVDDIALPFGAIRLRGNGSDAGHNGLKNIADQLGTQNYARLRFGIGNDFPRGGQIDYVLGRFPEDERKQLPERIDVACDAIKAYCLSGLAFAMTHYNNK